MKIILYFFYSISICFGQLSFNGINTWTQSSEISLAGGGLLIDYENDFKNPGTFVLTENNLPIYRSAFEEIKVRVQIDLSHE